MKVEEILEEMENILLESARVPFTNKRLVEEDDFGRLIDELRESLPRELPEAQDVLKQRQRIMDEAQNRSNEIIQQAKNYMSKLTDENLITKQAQEQANELVNQARKEAERIAREAEEIANEIIGKARKEAQELNSQAAQYADQVFELVESNLDQTLTTVRKGHSELRQSRTV